MSVSINFIANNEEFLEIAPKPALASENQPNWLKLTSAYVNNKKTIDIYGDPTSTIKNCMPVADIINAGYHITLPCDVWVFNEGEDKIRFQWAYDGLKMITSQRSDQHETYPISEGFHKTVFKFLNHWIVKTPKNWSCLFIQPSHHDLPFQSFSAIVDTDKFPIPVHFPFLLKKDFSGLIPKGTPIIQVIPIRRDSFKATYSWDKCGKLARLWKKAHLQFFSRYLKNFRSAKNYDLEENKNRCPFGF